MSHGLSFFFPGFVPLFPSSTSFFTFPFVTFVRSPNVNSRIFFFV
jgi:hypothetical protein